jgi:hypothetical protein
MHGGFRSDEAYAENMAILEQRRTARLAEAPAAERKQMEYERGTIQWHIEVDWPIEIF